MATIPIKLSPGVWVEVSTLSTLFQSRDNCIRIIEADELPAIENDNYKSGLPNAIYRFTRKTGNLYLFAEHGATIILSTSISECGGFENGLGNSGEALTAFGELAVAQNFVQAGWSFPYKINPASVRVFEFNGGTATHSGAFALINSGANADGFAFIRTDDVLTYTPGIGALARFTAIYDNPQIDNTQLIGLGDNQDGWFFGYNTAGIFGIIRRRGAVDDFIPQSSWNKDNRPFLNPQKGNVYQISFQWLGFGMQYFSIEDENGNISLVHTIEYSNLNDDVSVNIPSLPLSAGCANSGNTTPVVLKTPSAIAMTQGEPYPIQFTIPIGYAYRETIGAGSNYLFSLYNPPTYEGKDNRLYLEPILLSLTTDSGNKSVTFRVFLNPVLTSPVYIDVQPEITPAQVDESAIAIAGGVEILTLDLSREDRLTLNVSDVLEKSKINADNIVAIVAEATGIVDITVALTFRSRV